MNIEMLKEKLTGFDKDVEVKIKLHTGEVKEIYDLSFRNKCVGGDNIIYIEEVNPYKEKYSDDIEDLIIFAEEILSSCIEAGNKGHKKYGENFDDKYILNIIIMIREEIDFYIEKCNLRKEVTRYCENGYEILDEVLNKIEILKNFIL